MDLQVLGIILTLVVMEGLLSADNALVLAVMTNKLKDPAQRKKALFYGMWGAVIFRAFFIFVGVWLVKLWFIKVLGALYLGKIVYDHFRSQGQGEDEAETASHFENTFMHRALRKVGIHLSFFWSIVISVELMDLAFSVDSILAALALSDKFWVLLLGGVLGFVMMRGVAGAFQKLIDRVPEMEHTAFILIGVIALKMFITTIHEFAALFGYKMAEIHISHIAFFAVLIITFAGTFVVHAFRKNKNTDAAA